MGLIWRVLNYRKLSQLADGLEGFENLGNPLGALVRLLAELGGEGFRVLAVGGDELLDRGDLGGQGGGPGEDNAGFVRLGKFLRFSASQGAL